MQDPVRKLRPTKADPSNLYTVSALAYLQQAHQYRIRCAGEAAFRLQQRTQSIKVSDTYWYMSAAIHLKEYVTQAAVAWRTAGRTHRTLQPYIDQSQRVNGIRWMFPGEV